MNAILRLDWRAATRSVRNVVTLIAVVLLAIGFGPIARQQKIGDLATTAFHAKDHVKAGVDDVERYYTSRVPALHRTSVILNHQWQASNTIWVGVTLADEYNIRDGMTQLGQWEIRGARTGYPGVVSTTLPTEADGRRKLLTVAALTARNERMHTVVSDASSTLEQGLPMLAMLLPFLVMLLTADLWLTNSAHRTITAALPVSLRAQAAAKVLTRVALPLLVVALVILAGFGAAVVTHGVGDLSYPVALALGARLVIVPLWAEALLLMGFAVVASLFVCTLMLVLNAWLGNVYWSFLGGAAIAAVPLVFPAVARTLWFTPLAGLAPQRLMDGTFQNEAGNWALGLAGGTAVLLVWTGVMLVLFAQIVNRRQS